MFHAFQTLLDDMGRSHSFVGLAEQIIESILKSTICVDGFCRDYAKLTRGIWEAKDANSVKITR